MEIFYEKLLTSRTEQLYHAILINAPCNDGRQGSLRKPDYIFGYSSDHEDRHSTECITFSFVHTNGETSWFQHNTLTREVH